MPPVFAVSQKVDHVNIESPYQVKVKLELGDMGVGNDLKQPLYKYEIIVANTDRTEKST